MSLLLTLPSRLQSTAGQIEQVRDEIAQLTQMVAEIRRDNGHGESASV